MSGLITDYQTMIHKSRYAKWRDDLGRRESWEETVARYFDFFEEHLLEKHNFQMSDIRPELEQAVLNLDLVPSMRCIMTAGPALKRDNSCGYNPVIGSTRIVTKEYGNIPIAEICDQSVSVLNKNSEWTRAKINCFGEQPIYKVSLRLNSNSLRDIECTGNHRWVLDNGRVLSTEQLREGDRLPFVSRVKPQIDDDYILGVRHGIVYGDGTATKKAQRVLGYMIRLCGQSRELLQFFDGYPVCYPPSANGDPIVMLYDGFAATHGLKELPRFDETESYLLGFIRGWLAADGSISKNSQVCICVEGRGKEWLYQNSERLGFVIQHFSKQPDMTNYGKRTRDSFKVFFSRSSFCSDDLLCSWKKELFRPLDSHFVVTGVALTDKTSNVYCAEVPDTNTFVIEGGLVTGNCSYLVVDHPHAFDEAMHTLMNGVGVGFSVEDQYVRQLPSINEHFEQSNSVIHISDSKAGWARGLRELISLLYAGQTPSWDTSRVRGPGERLKTFGGRASGPRPLEDLFAFCVRTFQNAKGRRLSSLEAHDILCKIGEVVVVGGVRRSAMISLSDLGGKEMANAKQGAWWEHNVQRALSNNSAVYEARPSLDVFLDEWTSLYNSKSGERGLFNRSASKRQAARNGRRNTDYEYGTNPCSEVIMRPNQYCNLSESVVRSDDTRESLINKVRLASILGTFQSTLTDFKYLRKVWQKTTEEERLLGVSLTGILDHPTLCYDTDLLQELRQVVVDTNKTYAEVLGIQQSVACTVVKPSGTVSQLVDSASGIHPRWAEYYVRTVRGDIKDPMSQFMIDQGVPNEPDVTKPHDTVVFSFPQKAPEGSRTRKDISAIEHLEISKTINEYWCEHKASITVNVKEEEWLDVAAWVWRNFDVLSGVSFLPYSEHSYRQAPYQECTKDEYDRLVSEMPKNIDWDKLSEYEKEDTTTGSQELSCGGGSCELVDIT